MQRRRQYGWAWAAWGIAAVLGIAGALASGPASAGPKISVEKMRVELGTVTAGEIAEAEFPLANSGSETLKIAQVTTSCGCTTTSYPASLQPGEKGILKARLASSPIWTGAVEKHVTVLSNDPEQPSVDLVLAAQMRPLFKINPTNPASINYKKGEVIHQIFTVTADEGSKVKITGATPAGAQTEAKLLPAEAGEKPGVWRVDVTAHPPERGGDFLISISLQTDSEKIPAIPLIITAMSQDGITVSPSFMYMGTLAEKPANDPARVIILLKRSGAFKVTSVKSDSPALDVELQGAANATVAATNSFYTLTVRYKGGWKKGQVAGKIVVTTDDPTAPTLEVPYQAVVE